MLRPEAPTVYPESDAEITAGELFTPLSDNYAVLPIDEGFDLEDGITKLSTKYGIPLGRDLILFVFSSTMRPGADQAGLIEHDDKAYQEVMGNSALLYYFKGETDENGHCLSFCIWTDLEEAKRASRGQAHSDAKVLAGSWYESFKLKRYRVSVQSDGLRLKDLSEEQPESDT